MTRDEFIKIMGLTGLGALALPQLLTSCKKKELNVTFDGKVLIIGAGAAGLMAGHLLHQHGIDFTILEARSRFGGRVIRDQALADFPIDLGAEWVHDSPDIFSKMIHNPNTQGTIDLVPYNPTHMQFWLNGQLSTLNVAGSVYGEYKFKRSTWYGFFEEYIVPDIESKIIYNTPIANIDYSNGTVQVSDTNQVNLFNADKVLVTVPINVLKSGMIQFTPALPQVKLNALDDGNMPDGIKVFMEFSENFYPDILAYNSMTGNDGNGEIIYYNAAFKKESNKNILALFTVGSNATQYTSLGSDQEIIDYILSQLDEIFDGKPTQTLMNSVVQNWSAEQYTQGSYNYFGNDNTSMAAMNEPIDAKVYFSGEALHEDSSATVQGAGLHAIGVIEKILQGG